MASYVTTPRNKSASRDKLSKTVHAISYATATPVQAHVKAQPRNSYTLPPATQARTSISGGSYVSKQDIDARRHSKNQYGISQSMHASSSSSFSMPTASSYSSIDYDPYQKYKNPAADGGANAHFSPHKSSSGFGVPTSVGSLSKMSVRTRSTESVPEVGIPPPPNFEMERRISTQSSVTYDAGATTGLISEGDPVICHKIDYEIKGTGMQMVEIELDPDESCIAEAGAVMFLEDYIFFDTKLGDGSEPKKGFFKKLVSAGGRIMAGEPLFLTHFTNKGHEKSRVAFGAPYPGVVVPINLAELPLGKITCQRDAFLCAAYGTKVTCSFNKRIGSGFFGGEGFVLQKLEGDGMVFIHASGHIIKRELNRGRIRLDAGCLVAYTSGIDFEIEAVKGLKSMYFSGEGSHLAILKGTGTVWMQSLPFSRIADRIHRNSSHFGSSA